MAEQKSLKTQAEEVMTAVNQDLQQAGASKPSNTGVEVDRKANALVERLFNVVSDVDIDAAAERVEALRQKYPDIPPTELVQKLIREKCQRTGAVGAVTSGAGLIPGLGTATAVTLGVAADIGATFKLQAELVLEIAAAYNYPLTEEEKQRLVMLITGLSAGTSALARRAGQAATIKIGEKFAEKAVLKALPIIGVAASAGTNVLSTYIIGQRADAYFRLGPDAVGSWADSLRMITGVDERKLAGWLADNSRATGAVVAQGAGKVGQAGKTAGEMVVSGAGRVAGTAGPLVATGARRAGATAQVGIRAYFRWVVTFWTAVFRFFRTIVSFIWTVLSFVPRKIMGLFRSRNRSTNNGQ